MGSNSSMIIVLSYFLDQVINICSLWQATLPDDGLPICIVLYADKSLASSWGAKKLYPIIARLANLPRSVRNGQGVGGGRVVGLLPVVRTTSKLMKEYLCNTYTGG